MVKHHTDLNEAHDKAISNRHRGHTEAMDLAHLPVWKKVLLAVSAVLMGVGGMLQGVSYVRSGEKEIEHAPPVATTPDRGLLSTRQLLQEPSPTTESIGDANRRTWLPTGSLAVWSPALFRMGFGFFAGFCIAYTARIFIRILIIVVGVVWVVLLGLQYGGLIDVNWTAIQTHYDTIAQWLGQQTANFHLFITGYIPSSAMTVLGLVVGFKGRR